MEFEPTPHRIIVVPPLSEKKFLPIRPTPNSTSATAYIGFLKTLKRFSSPYLINHFTSQDRLKEVYFPLLIDYIFIFKMQNATFAKMAITKHCLLFSFCAFILPSFLISLSSVPKWVSDLLVYEIFIENIYHQSIYLTLPNKKTYKKCSLKIDWLIIFPCFPNSIFWCDDMEISNVLYIKLTYPYLTIIINK